MGVKFELSSEDQFKPERDDISKNAQRMAKYSIITCFFDGASALR
jgi:hypothetical protein